MKKFVKIEMILLFIPVSTFILFCVTHLLSKKNDSQIENTISKDESFITDVGNTKQNTLYPAPIDNN